MLLGWFNYNANAPANANDSSSVRDGHGHLLVTDITSDNVVDYVPVERGEDLKKLA